MNKLTLFAYNPKDTDEIKVEKVNAAPYLHKGDNVVVVLQHNWGNITTFQRTGNKKLGQR